MQRLIVVGVVLLAATALIGAAQADDEAGLVQQQQSYSAQQRRRSLTGRTGRALQQATPVPVCTWLGTKDGACKDYPSQGCCRVNSAYILQNFPDSMANKMAVFPTDATVCAKILAPTKLDSVKAADVDRCYNQGSTNRCYVHYDPDADTVSCEQQTLWTGTDSLAACQDSLVYNYTTCLQTPRGNCSSNSNAGRCTNVFPVYFKELQKLSSAKHDKLVTLMGGPALPKLRQMASCVASDIWLGATMGQADKRPFASSWRELGTYVSDRVRTALSGQAYSLVWGSNCTGAAVLKRAAIANADCGAIALSNATVDSGQSFADPVKVADATQLQQCLATENCEVAWQPSSDGTGAYCRAAPDRTESLVASLGLDGTKGTLLFAAYHACYLPNNRFNRTSCIQDTTHPAPYDTDFQRRLSH